MPEDILTRTESRPGRGAPPGNNEAQESAEARAPGLRGPEIDRPRRRRGRTHLGDDGRGDIGEHHCDQVGRPEVVSFVCSSSTAV